MSIPIFRDINNSIIRRMRKIVYFALVLFAMPLIGQNNGVGGNINAKSSCVSESDRASIRQNIRESKKRLGKFAKSEVESRDVTDLIFPLKMVETIPGYNDFYAYSNFVDHDDSSGVQDYDCKTKTYDGHLGVDIFTFPFAWHLYENDLVHVVSMFEGRVLLKQDDNFDMNCSPEGQWNSVFVEHEDGSVMIYGHLKSGSLTTKQIGETVEKGEYLGVVASSGFSDGPHLHIEYYDEDVNLLDPFEGDCNSLNSNSLWESQPVHTNPKINAVLTHNSQPRVDCGLSNEVSDLSNSFQPNDEIFAGVYITDYQAGDVIVTEVYGPDNNFYGGFNSFNNNESFNWFWNSAQLTLTDVHPKGTWRIVSELRGETVTHTFEFGDDLSSVNDQNNSQVSIYPNPSYRVLNIVSEESIIGSHYELYDSNGKSVKNGILKSHQLATDELVTGLYFLIIVNDNTSIAPMKFFKI